MKNILTVLIAVFAFVAAAHADDYSVMGFKGKVKRAVIDDQGEYLFDVSGNVYKFQAITASSYFYVDEIRRTSKGFVGDNDGDAINVTVKSGRITNINYVYNGGNWNLNYTYNSDGFVSKVVETRSWTEQVPVYNSGSARVNTNGAETYLKKYKDALAKGKVAEAQKYLKLYQQAVAGASVSVRQSSVTYKTERHSSSSSATFSYLEKDKFGNWTKRIRYEDGDSETEYQSIEYQPEFLSEYEWNKEIAPTTDLETIENYYNRSSTPSAYRQKAKEKWNELAVNYVKNRYRGNNKIVLSYADKAIASSETREVLYQMVRDDVYAKQVANERDFARVKEVANMKTASGRLFVGQQYNDIVSRYNRLRSDSINYLLSCSERELAAKNYGRSISYARSVLDIDPDNSTAKSIFTRARSNEISDNLAVAEEHYTANNYGVAEPAARRVLELDPNNNTAFNYVDDIHYNQLKAKVKAKTVTEADYTAFLNENPNSKYTTKVQNDRALLISSNFTTYNYRSEMERINEFPMDEATRKKVNSRYEHQRYLSLRGRFFHMGLAGNVAGGKGAFDYGGGVGMRFGWCKSWVNLYVGAEVQKIGYLRMPEDDDTKVFVYPGEGSMSAVRLNVPVALRFNLVRDWDSDFYISAGVVYNKVMSAKYSDGNDYGEQSWYSDKKIANDGTLSPRVGLGWAFGGVGEFEIYGIMEPSKGVFNEDYAKSDPAIYSCLSPKISKSQFEGKWRIGATLRVLF